MGKPPVAHRFTNLGKTGEHSYGVADSEPYCAFRVSPFATLNTSQIATEIDSTPGSGADKIWSMLLTMHSRKPRWRQLDTYKYQCPLSRLILTLLAMNLISRPPNVPSPFPIHALDDDLIAFLERPYEENAAAGSGLPVATTTPNSPETRDRLLAYAYLIYDAVVTRQIPQGSIPPGHSALLLPLMELLHELHPHNPPIALLLGCVYHHYDLTQRSFEINSHILQYDPQNVRSRCSLLSRSLIRGMHRCQRCVT